MVDFMFGFIESAAEIISSSDSISNSSNLSSSGGNSNVSNTRSSDSNGISSSQTQGSKDTGDLNLVTPNRTVVVSKTEDLRGLKEDFEKEARLASLESMGENTDDVGIITDL
ncbi:hypothetical protein H4219_005666, partial [Mycoemilia scoparia]